jgi:LAO/AO transport system kinase
MEAGELRRIARAISTVEDRAAGYEEVLARAYRQPPVEVVGVTGPPGAGKSTLIDALTAQWAAGGERIAVLAIDPSSPYSGGAVLGDRIRRARSAGYPNTYFRSLAARGHLGGLSDTASDLVAVLGLFAFRRVILETVGAGQGDVEIDDTADCTVVMTVPGLGDGVQAAKAGLMEIGDVFVVNKADLPGADDARYTIERELPAAYAGEPGINTRRQTPGMQHVRQPGASPGLAARWRRHGSVETDAETWVPPVIMLVAAENRGVPELARTVDTFIAWSDRAGRMQQRRRERAYAQVVRALTALLLAPYERAPGTQELPEIVRPFVERVAQGAQSPLEAARALLRRATDRAD